MPVDPAFLEMFSFPLIRGDRATVLADNLDIREVLYRKKLAIPASQKGPARDWCADSGSSQKQL